jgi:hypothetical protein
MDLIFIRITVPSTNVYEWKVLTHPFVLQTWFGRRMHQHFDKRVSVVIIVMDDPYVIHH